MQRTVIDYTNLPKYVRKDTSNADPSERPTLEQYDRYVYLLELGKKHQYDGTGIAEESPFLIQDSLINAILIKSNQSLITIGKQFGFDTGEVEEWQAQSTKAYNQKLWNESLGCFTTYDLRGNKQILHKEIGGLFPLFAGIPSPTQAEKINEYLMSYKRNNC